MRKRRAKRSSADLVEAALRRGYFPKYIGIELARRDPYEAGARRVCDAYRKGRFRTQWEAAFLLGCLRHPVAYETVRGMFSDDSLPSSYGYLGQALVNVDRVRAASDLCSLVMDAPTEAGREEAAMALASVPSTAGRLAVIDSAASSKLGRKLAGRLLVKLRIGAAVIEDWLASDDRSKVELACETIAFGAGGSRTRHESDCHWRPRERRRLLALAERAIVGGRADPKPYARTWLRRGKQKHSIVWICTMKLRRVARFVLSHLGLGEAARA